MRRPELDEALLLRATPYPLAQTCQCRQLLHCGRLRCQADKLLPRHGVLHSQPVSSAQERLARRQVRASKHHVKLMSLTRASSSSAWSAPSTAMRHARLVWWSACASSNCSLGRMSLCSRSQKPSSLHMHCVSPPLCWRPAEPCQADTHLSTPSPASLCLLCCIRSTSACSTPTLCSANAAGTSKPWARSCRVKQPGLSGKQVQAKKESPHTAWWCSVVTCVDVGSQPI